MAKNASRSERWAVRVVLGSGAVVVIVAALPIYMRVTATPLHPQPQRAPSVVQESPAGPWTPAVDRARQVIRAALGEQNLPGVSVAVGVGGDLAWAEGFGWADLETRAPVTPATRFKIGTASTALTSAGAGVLLEKGALNLDAEIQAYVPQFPVKAQPVTLRQLMAHSAGLRTDSGDEGPLFHQRCERPLEALPVFADDDLLFEPGSQSRHSKYGWILVSAAIEAAAQQRFLTFMREQVFVPLGMTGTGAESSKEENPEHHGEEGEDAPPVVFFVDVFLRPLGIVGPKQPPPRAPHLTTAYFPRYGADPRLGLHPMRGHNLSCYAGAMAFFSTPSDLVRFGLALNAGTLLQASTVEQLQAPERLSSGEQSDRALGWDLQTATLAGAPTRVVSVRGEDLGGEVATILIARDRGIVVAVTSNISYADTSGLAVRVADEFAGAATPEGNP